MEKNKKFTTYTFKQFLGMEGEGDCFYEYMSPEDKEQYRKEREEYVQRLKETGDYGKEWLCKVFIEHDDTYDKVETSTESYRMVIWNTNEETK